ncbi:MAG: DNA gyrase/topoisomerase IV subunit A [Candidatus Scalindua sp. AMX11]|nr:MAG: DNA gyrase/topoisomerase IV subunit A [Candidatus Scalindua sp.]NOG82492.1 DNA gyrase/topoisomerase IV subunit A [Planctomycetota bacterium]RZV93925.1 MAG: DNA gyrase/topoisomerase IV subunit A [Candidatus Scalindua sp. SCAELEC01]TDE65546.1 MAG: DNA gyrase/topoisomerase IV subunit A [Candidatus Scalindua sp. AMX11]GJQ58128.1 MAG: DNA topoisomerase IV subunit A [Candidatus Scalindua sp.]
MPKKKSQQKIPSNSSGNNNEMHEAVHVSKMYSNWFLEYASYVILERAVPALLDGLKPVQRRILHSMKQMDDGRFHKAANVIGHTMQYHPHGDAAIGDALVNMGQKELLIETQGNWGDVRTGDSAAAPRYIEARLSKFALEVAFNNQITDWQLSYDGRKKEPIILPVKFPLLLAQGTEGIAVGLATKIMPHNFIELLEASIEILRGNKTDLLPDFPTGGMADVSNYNEGLRGGKIRVRAKIDVLGKRSLVIRNIPYTTTTSSVMVSIVKASENNKIKIKRVVDNTAKDVEIVIELPNNVSPDITVDALYAFTECEVSISPNACIINDDKPHFLDVNEILKISTSHTVALLKRELQYTLEELLEKLHFSSLEKIFIEKRIYRDIEECETWDAVIEAIYKGMEPYKKFFVREMTDEDVVKLTEIKIKRISRYDSLHADESIKALKSEIKQVKYDLKNLVDYSIAYFENLIKKYGEGRERKTEIRNFDTIQVAQVAIANQKLYMNRKDGFIGYGLKKEEYVGECSDIDVIIVFLANGTFLVTRIAEKAFVGKDIIHAQVWKKNDDRMVYHMIYLDGNDGASFVKRFAVTSVTYDKPYDLTLGTKGSKVIYFSVHPNSESEVVAVSLRAGCSARKMLFEFDFSDLAIKGRSSKGNRLTKYPIRKVVHKKSGISTLGGLDIWYDETVGRLNSEKRGRYLGKFEGEDRVLVAYKDGTIELTSFELTNRYDTEKTLLIEKDTPETIITVVHFDGESKKYYVKRFTVQANAIGASLQFMVAENGNSPIIVTTEVDPKVKIHYLFGRKKERRSDVVHLNTLVDIKGYKARGNIISSYEVVDVTPIASEGPETTTEEGDLQQLELFEK